MLKRMQSISSETTPAPKAATETSTNRSTKPLTATQEAKRSQTLTSLSKDQTLATTKTKPQLNLLNTTWNRTNNLNHRPMPSADRSSTRTTTNKHNTANSQRTTMSHAYRKQTSPVLRQRRIAMTDAKWTTDNAHR